MKQYLNWNQVSNSITIASHYFKHRDIEYIIAMAKGGLVPARLMARHLDIKQIYSFGINFYDMQDNKMDAPIIYQNLENVKFFPNANVLIVDDIIDMGDSIKYVKNEIKKINQIGEIYVYSLCVKESTPKEVLPDFYSSCHPADCWVVMPWE